MAEGELSNTDPGESWQFNQDDTQTTMVAPTATAIPPQGPDGSISWTASEFIAHNKSSGWYIALAGCAVLLAFLVWLLTKDKISAAVVLIGALLFGIYAARKPRQLQYKLDGHGLSVGARYFGYHDFRSFAIVPEGAFNTIEFLPLKRFAPLITIYYDPSDETKIVALLSDRLPMEERDKAWIDRLMWRIRF